MVITLQLFDTFFNSLHLGKHIGGFDALSRIESAGQLKELNSQQEKLRKLQ